MTRQTIPKGWKVTTLGEVAEINALTIDRDYGFREIEYIDITSVEKHQLNQTQKLKLSEAPSRAKRIVRDNDILISTVRPNLKHYCYIKKAKPNLVASTGFAIVSAKTAHPYYLYCLLTTDGYTAKLTKIADSHTSAYPSYNPDVLANSEFIIPDIQEQKAIAEVLSSLDDKIELLRKQNKTLENIAQALFKHWFVDFEFPDEKGRPYKSSGGEMKDSELGEIPAGWKVGTVEDAVNIFDSHRIPLASNEREKRKGKYPYYGATTIMDYIDDYLFDGIYLLLAEDGSVMDNDGYPVLQYVWGKMWVNNHTHVLQGKNGYSTETLYLLFKKTKIAGIVNGAVQLKINQGNLLGLEIVFPEEKALTFFSELISPIFKKIRDNHQQTQTIFRLRDSLLPKLMKGEVRVGNF